MDRAGRIREPSEITEAKLTSQLARARQAAASIALLLEPEAQARVANPPAEATELACALASALTRAGPARTPQAAADIMLNAVREHRDNTAMKHAQRTPRPGNRRPRRTKE